MKRKYCEKCLGPILYDEKYDAYYCRYCNVWLETGCADPRCGFCCDRPKTPNKKVESEE